jgi:CheY-like chemotaxis protein
MLNWPMRRGEAPNLSDVDLDEVLVQALDAGGYAVILAGPALELLAANAPAAALLGASPDLRSALSSLRAGDGHHVFPDGASPLSRLERQENIADEHVAWPAGEGPPRLFTLRALPLRGVGDAWRGALLLFGDRGHQTADRLDLAVRAHTGAVRGFAMSVAHDVNNPLVALVAHLDFLHQELEGLAGVAGGRDEEAALTRLPAATAQMSESVRAAREAVDRIRLTIRDLRLLGQSPQATAGAADATRALDGARRLASVAVSQRARLTHAYGRLPALRGTESDVCQLVASLLNWGARRVPDGHAETADVRLIASAAPDAVEIEIAVSAPSFAAPSFLEGDDDDGLAEPSGDMSLSMCATMAARLGGSLVETADVAGATGQVRVFRLRLPVAEGPGDATGRPVPARTPAGPGSHRPKVLVIDDEEAVGTVCRRILQLENDVTVLTRGDDALVLLLQGARFDIILCDMMMPEMSGPEFYEALRAGRPEIIDRVVFMSGGAFTARSRDFLDRVPNSRIEKPFDPQVLSSLVRDRAAGRGA